MDVYNLVMWILIATIIITLVVVLCKVIGNPIALYFKKTAPERGDFKVFFKGRVWNVECPLLEESVYWDRFPTRAARWDYLPTLDCFVMRELANSINSILKNKPDMYKAEFILAFVQQNCRYIHDQELYGLRDIHAFPVCTAYIKKGDCEDSSALGACLSVLCGLDTIICLSNNHMWYAVNVDGHGRCIPFEGKKYLWCESTGTAKIGVAPKDQIPRYIFIPAAPSARFLECYTEYRDFDQYLDPSRI